MLLPISMKEMQKITKKSKLFLELPGVRANPAGQLCQPTAVVPYKCATQEKPRSG
jgi:hypothetical protein